MTITNHRTVVAETGNKQIRKVKGFKIRISLPNLIAFVILTGELFFVNEPASKKPSAISCLHALT